MKWQMQSLYVLKQKSDLRAEHLGLKNLFGIYIDCI